MPNGTTRDDIESAECRALAAKLTVSVRVFGFVTNMHELMDAADLIVTKPGGLTTTECLAKGKPMALVAPILGVLAIIKLIADSDTPFLYFQF